MTGKTMEKLRALLKTYHERLAKAQAETKPAPGEPDPRRRACGERLEKIVRPALDAFVAELKNAGHEASLQGKTDTADAYPSVALTFTPRTVGSGVGGTALASVLTFRYDPRRGIAVGRDIKPSVTKGRAVTSSTDRIGTMKVEAVSSEWVEMKTLSFIEAVLKAN